MPHWKLAANGLKSYFQPTGFKSRLRLTVDPTPADWIKHVQDQIASRGRYKDVTRQTKRDWNYLLIYNEDDCRGLKHVFDTAARELALWNALVETTFQVDATPKPIDIKIGWRRRRLELEIEQSFPALKLDLGQARRQVPARAVRSQVPGQSGRRP